LATAAGATVLELVDDAALAALTTTVGHFGRQLEAALRSGGLGATVVQVGPLLGCYVALEGDPVAPTNYDEARAICGNGVYPALFHALLDRGVAMAPGAYEVAFPSLAHTAAHYDATLEAAASAAAAVVSRA